MSPMMIRRRLLACVGTRWDGKEAMRGGGEVNDAEEKGRRERRMDLIDMVVEFEVGYRIVRTK